jgi:protein dithiol:quinone oxidoreductase
MRRSVTSRDPQCIKQCSKHGTITTIAFLFCSVAMSRRHAVHTRNQFLLLAIAVLSIGAVVLATVLQQTLKLNPCTLCITQRYLFVGLGLCALLGAVAGSLGSLRPTLAVLGGLIACTGIGVAVYHLYVVANPTIDCGRDRLAEFINGLALADWFPNVFMAFGGCGDVVPPFMGLSYPTWALLLFVAGLAVMGWVLITTLRECR